jgi:DNA ligase-3
VLETKFKEIENSIVLSEMTRITTPEELKGLMYDAIERGQEGLVLKDSEGVYKANARHWLKMKRDYLSEGAMADSADLVVLGAYKGSGKHGGLYSTFLMGCLDSSTKVFKTVCKVHNGLDDKQLNDFTSSIAMATFDIDACPKWLHVQSALKPDWICVNPKKSPVFEVSGFEFSESKRHTATDHEGQPFSIRFPRVTRIRDDKTYKTATRLQELRALIKVSRDNPASLMKAVSPSKATKGAKSTSAMSSSSLKSEASSSIKKKYIASDEDEDDDDDDTSVSGKKKRRQHLT